MTKCAELIEQEDLNVDFVDINSGTIIPIGILQRLIYCRMPD